MSKLYHEFKMYLRIGGERQYLGVELGRTPSEAKTRMLKRLKAKLIADG